MFFHLPTTRFSSPLYQFDREMDALFQALQLAHDSTTVAESRTIRPNFHSRSNEKETHVDVELPGVVPQDVSVEVKDGILTVLAKRFDNKPSDTKSSNKEQSDTEEKEVADKKEEPEQKATTTYKLRMRLGRDADEEGIMARNDGNGMLRITVPMKKPEARKIVIA